MAGGVRLKARLESLLTSPRSTEINTMRTLTILILCLLISFGCGGGEQMNPESSTETSMEPLSPEPSTPPVSPEPSTPPVSPEPSTPPVSPEPSTPPVSPEPSTPPVSPEPSTSRDPDVGIETGNPEGSIARKLHPRDFEREEDWVRETCSVYEDEDLPLPDGNFNANSNFPLDEDSVWTCVRRTESFQIDTEIRFYDNGTYSNNLTGWEVTLADAPIAFPPDQGCHRRGMPYNPTWETEEPGFVFDRRGQWGGKWGVYEGRLYLKEGGLPGRLKSYAFSFNEEKFREDSEKEETILRLDDMVETYSDGSAINYQKDLEPSELDSEEIRQKREELRREYEQTEEFKNCQTNSQFGGCWTNPQLWKSELGDEGTVCRIRGRDID